MNGYFIGTNCAGIHRTMVAIQGRRACLAFLTGQREANPAVVLDTSTTTPLYVLLTLRDIGLRCHHRNRSTAPKLATPFPQVLYLTNDHFHLHPLFALQSSLKMTTRPKLAQDAVNSSRDIPKSFGDPFSLPSPPCL